MQLLTSPVPCVPIRQKEKLLMPVTQTLKVTFTPTDTVNYETATKDVTINVLKGTPVITWANPGDITYGTALSVRSSMQLLTSPVPRVRSGSQERSSIPVRAQTLKVTFTPTDAVNYETATKDVTINVLKGTPVITWANPATSSMERHSRGNPARCNC